jgi:FdhD protein
MIEDIYQKVTPAENGFEIEGDRIFGCIKIFSENQEHYQTTRGSHAALILDDHMNAMGFAEDVGRHNALDKAIGKTLMNDQIANARILVLSSRTSHELVQKTARARIPVIISHSRPTSLAVEMGKALNMTLLFPDNGSDLVIVCGEHRITFK